MADSIARQLSRRRIGSYRLPPLESGYRDPWRYDDVPLTDKMVDAGRSAALHFLADGQVPILKPKVLEALWRRGGEDRELAELLHRLTEGQVA
ncbi:hypothetical protein [Mycolicibacterium iranicum]|uniref:Uncharacterized protein n=1 Tax=Mycolicibacterium iranicum TaxID=912594 RepID=A0ABT4HQ30_MYCIR|nr:hypothetical protein [Mycolicibacterium iranicum]MCZ0731879.1 hypothetical protein [Mycolicibacterium iranicum]